MYYIQCKSITHTVYYIFIYNKIKNKWKTKFIANALPILYMYILQTISV